MIMKREEGINHSMIKAVNKKGKVEDIRDAVSLGYMDLQKRNKSSLLARIKKLFNNTGNDITRAIDFSENI